MANKAFLVGADTLALQYCCRDVDSLAAVLMKYGYDVVRPRIDKTDVQSQFDDFVSACRQTDTLLIYFSGHGLISRGKLQFLLADDATKMRNIVNINDLIWHLDSAQAASKLVILDCCHAAAGIAEWRPDISDRYFILTASERLEKAKEIESFQGGFLTYKLCQFLAKPPEDRLGPGGEILLENVYQWLKQEALAYNAKGEDQVPIPNLLGNQKTSFVIGRYPTNQRAESLTEKTPRHPPRVCTIPRKKQEKLVGREVEIRTLESWLSSEQAWLMSIIGIGGIGKTTLVLEVLYRYLNNKSGPSVFSPFDVIIFISAKTKELLANGYLERGRPVGTLDDILRTVSIALGKEADLDRIPSGQRGDFIRRELSNQRSLLVLDGVEGVEDPAVIAFLRELPSPTKCLIISRRSTNIPHSITLNELSEQDAAKLLEQVCMDRAVYLSGRQINLLLDRIGGVPLALVWFVEQMESTRDFDVALQRLEQPGSMLLEYILGEPLRQVRDTPAYDILTLLSLLSKSASEDLLRCVTGLTSENFAQGIKGLQLQSLVSRDGGRYSVFKITKSYMRRNVGKLQTNRLQGRMLDYYIALADQYSDSFWESERDNFISLIEDQLRNDSIELAQKALQAVKSYIERVEQSHYLDDVQYISDVAVKLARNLGDLVHQIDFLLDYYEMVHFLRNEFQKAEALNQEALNLSKKTGYSIGIAKAYRNLGGLAKAQSRFPEALDLFTKALEHLDESQEEEIRVVKGLLSSTHRKLGDYDEARAFLEEEIEYCRSKGEADLTRLSIAICRLATSFLEEKRPKEAIPLYEESMALDEKLGRHLSIGYNLFKLARCYNMMGDGRLADSFARRALDVFRDINDQALVNQVNEFLETLTATDKSS